MSYQYPICKCGDDGLRYCEKGDEYLHLQEEYEAMEKHNVSEPDAATFDVGDDSEALAKALAPHVYQAQSSWRGFRSSWCNHAMSPYTLENNHIVYVTSVYDAYNAPTVPDVGIYFDGEWSRAALGFSYLIAWPDFGLPDCTNRIFDRYVNAALGHMADMETVEIGCLGAHGRTGTFLACLDIASSGYKLTARKAINKVRAQHCDKAIESKLQEWFVRAFYARHNGKPIPNKPRPPKKKWTPATTTTTNQDGATVHYLTDKSDGPEVPTSTITTTSDLNPEAEKWLEENGYTKYSAEQLAEMEGATNASE